MAGKQQNITVVSLFSGCGGMDLGFTGGFDFLGTHYPKTAFQIIWANELNGAACRTYRKNIGHHIVEGDIWQIMSEIPQKADVVIGGFPCQDISVNGKAAGVDGKRSGLYRAMVEAVSRIHPKIFVAENVKGLLMRHNADSLQRVLSDFRSLGYEVNYRLYHAADYGVPQTRERVFMVGTRPDVSKFIPPQPVCEKHISAAEAIGDLELLAEDADFNHIWSLANKSAEQGNRKLKVVLYLLTYHGVICHQARDLFSAGSVANPKNDDAGEIYIKRALNLIEAEMVKASLRMEDALFIEYWGESVPPEHRIRRWLEKADAIAREWTPSKSLILKTL